LNDFIIPDTHSENVVTFFVSRYQKLLPNSLPNPAIRERFKTLGQGQHEVFSWLLLRNFTHVIKRVSVPSSLISDDIFIVMDLCGILTVASESVHSGAEMQQFLWQFPMFQIHNINKKGVSVQTWGDMYLSGGMF
jgi:hypothetical protein